MSSGSDVDDEYLQVAGQAKAATKRKRGRKVGSESDADISMGEESEWSGEEFAEPKKKTKGAAKKTRGGGGAADTAALNEEDLIDDEEDRERLAKMTEFEREMLLAERAEERQEQAQRKQLLAATGTQDDDEGKTTKRRGAARRSGREVREETAKKSAIEELKAARQRKAQGRKAHAAEDLDAVDPEDEDEFMEPAGYAGEESDLEDGEDRHGGPGGTRWAPREIDEFDEEAVEEADVEELKSIHVRRHRLEEWIDKPHFEATLPGCMVRMAAGERRNPDGSIALDEMGRPMARYMLMQVVGVEDVAPGYHKYMEGVPPCKSPYPFGPDKVKTNKWLRVSRGKTERLWPMAQVSNSGFTEAEHISWHQSCEGARSQVTRGEVAEVVKRLTAAEAYVYTAEDVARLLEEKRLKGQGGKNVALERARLERERDAALEAADEERLAEVLAEMDALEATARVAAEARQSVAASMAQLNRKNAKINFQTALKAGKETPGGGGVAGTLDPFSRRATRTKNYWNTQRQRGERGGEDEAPTEVEKLAIAAAQAIEARAAAAAEAPEITLVDLSELDLSLLDMPPKIAPIARKMLGSRAAAPLVTGSAAAHAAAGAPTLSLAEYKRRSGMAH